VVLDISTRRLVHWNVTEHPTAEWTVQQFRAFVTGDEPHRFVIHDHDALYSSAVDRALASMHLCALVYERQGWEYEVVSGNVDQLPLSEDELNALAKNGWELVGVVAVPYTVQFYFKRMRR
jgi:hypothetical protein